MRTFKRKTTVKVPVGCVDTENSDENSENDDEAADDSSPPPLLRAARKPPSVKKEKDDVLEVKRNPPKFQRKPSAPKEPSPSLSPVKKVDAGRLRKRFV